MMSITTKNCENQTVEMNSIQYSGQKTVIVTTLCNNQDKRYRRSGCY